MWLLQPNRCCDDLTLCHDLTLLFELAIQKARSLGLPLYVTTLDFKKAFDSVAQAASS